MSKPMTQEDKTNIKQSINEAADSAIESGSLNADTIKKNVGRLQVGIIRLLQELSAEPEDLPVPEASKKVVSQFALNDGYVVQLLVDEKIVTEDQVMGARKSIMPQSGLTVTDALIRSEIVTKKIVLEKFAGCFGMGAINLAERSIPADLIQIVPAHVARRYRIIPVQKDGATITVALCDPTDVDTLDSLRYILKANVEGVVAASEDIDAALKQYYPGEEEVVMIPTIFVKGPDGKIS